MNTLSVTQPRRPAGAGGAGALGSLPSSPWSTVATGPPRADQLAPPIRGRGSEGATGRHDHSAPETDPRHLLAAATAVLLALALAGCGGPPPTSPAPPGAAPPAGATAPHEQLTARPLGYAEQRLAGAADRLDPADGYPRATGADGHWQLGDADNWTSGFFAGTLWLLYEHTHDLVWRGRAERWTTGLESQAARTDTHDLGFMIFNSFGHEYLLTGATHARDAAVTAARSVATRYNPAVGAIKSWDVDASMPATWQF